MSARSPPRWTRPRSTPRSVSFARRVARLAQLDALALDAADREAAADERVEIDAARQHVAPRRLVGELDAGVLAQPLERLGGDQGQALARLGRRGPVVLALDAATGLGAHARHRRGERVAVGGDGDLLDDSAHAASVPSVARPLAASTSARNSASCPGSSTSVSACHCTPSRNGWRRSSIASTVPSGAQAVATQALAERVDRLVVEGVDLGRAGAEHARGERAGGDAHRVRGLRRELGLAVVLDVLVQRAAARDVERLRAAADAEQRHARGVGGARELELEAVERGLGRAERLVGAGAVGGGIEIRAAGEADAVEALEQRRRPRRAPAEAARRARRRRSSTARM